LGSELPKRHKPQKQIVRRIVSHVCDIYVTSIVKKKEKLHVQAVKAEVKTPGEDALHVLSLRGLQKISVSVITYFIQLK
jgi:hypothetical protein